MHTPRFNDGTLAGFETDYTLDVEPPRLVVGVEDDDLRRRLAFVLGADGYDVVPFRHHDAMVRHLHAAARWSGRNRPPDLLIFDDFPPHLVSRNVGAALDSLGLPVPVILLTEDPAQVEARLESELPLAAAFGRPFDLDDLRTVVTNLLPVA